MLLDEVSHIVMDHLVKRSLIFAWKILEFDFIAKATTKNNLSIEHMAKEWACLECTERSTTFLADSRELVVRIMCLISILVALETPNIMANSLVLGAVVLLAGTLEDDIWWPSFQKYAAEIAYMFLEGIALISVTTTKIEKEEATL